MSGIGREHFAFSRHSAIENAKAVGPAPLPGVTPRTPPEISAKYARDLRARLQKSEDVNARLRAVHPLHDILVTPTIEDFVPAVVEIPKGSKLKYELDKRTGLLMLDRVLYSSVHYPANYGFIPQSHADDGDPLDILVLMQEPVVPLTIVRARPIGGFSMKDDKGIDDKIVAVAVDDPAFAHLADVGEIPGHITREIQRFFEDYKALEHKISIVEGLYGKEQALVVIRTALDVYRTQTAWNKG